jgi:hypothetical protein
MDSGRAGPLLKLLALAAAPRRARTEHLTTVTTLYRDMDKTWVRAVLFPHGAWCAPAIDRDLPRLLRVRLGARSVPKPPSRPAE